MSQLRWRKTVRIYLQGASPSPARPSFHSVCVFKGLCSTIHAAAALLPQAAAPPESRGEENPKPSSVPHRVMLPVDALGREAPRGRGTGQLPSHALSWHCTITHGCSQPTLSSSQFLLCCQPVGLRSPYLPLQSCPRVPHLHSWLSMVGEEHLLGSSQTAFPPSKTLVFFSDTLTK